MTVRRIIPFIVMGIAIVWLLMDKPTIDESSDQSPFSDDLSLNYQMLNLTMKQFSADGQLTHQIEAQSIENRDEWLQFQQPLLTTAIDGKSWQIKADQAKTQDVQQNLAFIDNVKVKSIEVTDKTPSVNANETTNDQLSFLSSSLLFTSSPRTMKTESKIHLTHGPFHLTGTGFEFSLESQQYLIGANVSMERRP